MLKDVLGREIKVGQIVAYPGRQSSLMWLTVAPVKEVGKDSIKVEIDTNRWDGKDFSPVKKLVTVRSIDRVVIAKEAA